MYKSKLLKKIITSILLSISIFTSYVDESYANLGRLNFNNLNIEKGISQSTVDVIFQDSNGYIWLGTHDGLNKYNGYEFEIYNYEEGENSITHNGITDITEDSKGNIWVTTTDGVNKINVKTDEISNYTEENNKIKDDGSTEIVFTKDNKILVGTYEGLNLYNEEKDSFETVLTEENGLISSVIYSVDEDKYGNIWIGTELGVNKVSKDFKVLETYPINTEENPVEENVLGDSEIYIVYCDDKNDLVWAGSDSSGVLKINTKTGEVKQYVNNSEDENSLPNNQIGAIMKDSSGNLWVGTTEGLALYNEKNDNFKVYKNKIYDKTSLVYNDVRALMEDNEGVIWVGTYSGVSIFDTKSSIKNFNAGLDKDYLLSENMVHGVYEDDDGYLWVGTKSMGVDIIDRKNNTSTNISMENNDLMPSNSINDITGDKNLVFIATDSGLVKIDRELNTINNYSVEDGLVDERIKDILLDDKGYLWLGTSSGLSILNVKSDEMINMDKYISKDSYVRHIYQTSDGNYVLGFFKDGGLSYINTKEKTIKNYKNIHGDKSSISSSRVRYINEDSKGNLWIGTSYGLNKFDVKTETFTRYTAKDGIANNTIYGVLVDDNDNIWVSTNKGISKINSETGDINNLSVTDGLQANEFNGNASFKSKSGELFFGGVNGLSAFYPEDINNQNINSKIVFDGFEINDKKYSEIDGLKLSHNTDTIKINFFTPIYSSNKNIRYEYKLIGSKGSVATTKENYVIYNDLKPGKYTFEVKSIDGKGNISDKISVDFRIKHPIWASPMAFVVYITLVILFITKEKRKIKHLDKLVKKRTKKLQEQMDRNEVLYRNNLQLEENKNRYLVNLSHELRTPLNVISSTNQLITGLMRKDNYMDKEKTIYYIDISEKNCSRLLNLVNNIVDNTKLQNDMYKINPKETDIVYLVEETALTLLDYVKSKNIQLIIDPEVEEKMILCDSYEIERCIVNLVGNAAKFTPEGGSITITVDDLGDKVKISVKDTGIGIDEKYHKTIFDRFSQADDGVKGGSGLGLTITSQIVKLHKGDIYVESKLGEGSTFVIVLPVNPNV